MSAVTPFDYEGLRDDDVAPLILEFGRALTLTRAVRGTTAAPIAGKPWLPTTKGDLDTDAAVAQSIAVTGVFLSLVKRDRDGQTVEAKTQAVLFVAEDDFPEELGPDWKCVDGTRTYEVLNSQPLKPGPTEMLYRMELAL